MFSSYRKSHPVLKIVNRRLVDLPAPRNLSAWWNFGFLLRICLILQILTGLFLAIHYTSHVDLAFSRVVHITRDVNYGWLLRTLHATGGSWFFICIYIHIGRGIYYNSFFIRETWSLGVVLFVLTIAAAFIGYVLPWGQIRFWGATVITNLLSAIPYFGSGLVEWVWGGFAVDNATLNRFFAIHFLLPFLILAVVVLHLLFLHQTGSNNPLGINSDRQKIPFHRYYTLKDLIGIILILGSLIVVALFFPNILGEPDNFLPANPLVTPIHIKPEWYFLWVYAILRSIPNKLGGVVAVGAALLILLALPFIHNQNFISNAFYPINQIIFWLFIVVIFSLTWIGGCPIEDPYEILGRIFTFLYFFLLIINPIVQILWDKLNFE